MAAAPRSAILHFDEAPDGVNARVKIDAILTRSKRNPRAGFAAESGNT
jgi:hypothetical protein